MIDAGPHDDVRSAAEDSVSPETPAGVGRFAFRFAPRYRRAARLFGITPDTAWVHVGERELEARYGRWRVLTPLPNVASVRITGPYRFLKTAGPPRLGVTDRGLTFASNGTEGVEIAFVEPVRGIDRWGLLRHPELTVTVADPAAFATLIGRRIG